MISLLLYHRFKVIQTLQNKANRLVLGVYDQTTANYLAIKFHLQIWEEFGNREPDTLKTESTVISNLQGVQGVAKLVTINLEPRMDPNIGKTTWIGLQWYQTYNQLSLRPPRGIEGLSLWCKLASTCLKFISKGIVHRDLKPENILIQKNGNSIDYKIIDFGVATIIDDPQFAWNEFIREDVYNLGKILYYIATGKRVYRLQVEDLKEKDFILSFHEAQIVRKVCQKFISAPLITSRSEIFDLIKEVRNLAS